MNHRLQFFPSSGIREPQADTARQNTAANRSRWQDTKVYRSWLVYDSDWKPERMGVNWNVVIGLGTAVILSIGFWTAMGVVFARWLR